MNLVTSGGNLFRGTGLADAWIGEGLQEDQLALEEPAPLRALILGGTGFIGSEVTRACLEAGIAVRVLARRDSRESFTMPFEFIPGAVEDPRFLDRALDGIDWVVHAVGCPPPAASSDDFDSTAAAVFGLDTLLEALRTRAGVGLTFVSSGGAVYGDVQRLPVDEETRCRPISAYGLSKLMAEDSIVAYSARYGIPARILRVSNAYGVRQDASSGQGVIGAMLRAAVSGDTVPIFDGGTSVRDFVHVSDVSRAVVALRPSLAEPQVVNVGSGVGHSVSEIHSVVERVTGSKLRVRLLPRRPIDVHAIVLDISRLKTMMMWRPRLIEDGIAQTWSQLTSTNAASPDELSA